LSATTTAATATITLSMGKLSYFHSWLQYGIDVSIKLHSLFLSFVPFYISFDFVMQQTSGND